MQELRNKILDGVADGNKINWGDLIESLSPKEYNAVNGVYRGLRSEGLVHREVTIVDGKSVVHIVAGDFRTNKNQPIAGGE